MGDDKTDEILRLPAVSGPVIGTKDEPPFFAFDARGICWVAITTPAGNRYKTCELSKIVPPAPKSG